MTASTPVLARAVLGVVVVAGVGIVGVASAQQTPDTPPPTPPPPSGAPASAPEDRDLVRLRNGGFVRGTVTQYVPGSRVVIVAGGETLHFDAAEVLAVEAPAAAAQVAPATPEEPAAETPVPPAPTPSPMATAAHPAPRARSEEGDAGVLVHFDGDEPLSVWQLMAQGVTEGRAMLFAAGARPYPLVFARQTRAYAPLCDTPCELRLRPGQYRLALARERSDTPIEVESTISINAETRVSGHYESRAGTRAAGWVIMIASFLVGGAWLVASVRANEGGALPTAFTVAGVSVGMLIATLVEDSAAVEATPY